MIDVTRPNPFPALTISCSTVFCTREHDMPLQHLGEKLGSNACKGLLGFHALSGSDQTAKFFSFSKLTCWDTYMASTQSTLKAFENLGRVLDEETEKNLVNFA